MKEGYSMQLPIFLAYIDFCKHHHKAPEILELNTWKAKYDKR
jgi:hypothetical protein